MNEAFMSHDLEQKFCKRLPKIVFSTSSGVYYLPLATGNKMANLVLTPCSALPRPSIIPYQRNGLVEVHTEFF